MVRRVTGAGEAIRGFAGGEAVKADELHEESGVASRSHSVAVPRVPSVAAVTGCRRVRAPRLAAGLSPESVLSESLWCTDI